MLPVRARKLFATTSDDQKFVSIELYQGESTDVTKNRKLGQIVARRSAARPARLRARRARDRPSTSSRSVGVTARELQAPARRRASRSGRRAACRSARSSRSSTAAATRRRSSTSCRREGGNVARVDDARAGRGQAARRRPTTSEMAKDRVDPAVLKVADAVGALIEAWGFKRNMGRMWAVLYLEDHPLTRGRSRRAARAVVGRGVDAARRAAAVGRGEEVVGRRRPPRALRGRDVDLEDGVARVPRPRAATGSAPRSIRSARRKDSSSRGPRCAHAS